LSYQFNFLLGGQKWASLITYILLFNKALHGIKYFAIAKPSRLSHIQAVVS